MKALSTLLLLGCALAASPLPAQDYAAVSETTAGTLPDAGIGDLAMTGDGRYVVFSSPATDLVAGDTNGRWDVFLRDTVLESTELISVAADGTLGNSDSRFPQVSEDGRFVVFASHASNLVAGDSNARSDIFLVDRSLDTIELISVATSGVQQDDESYAERCCDVSDDGRTVVWATLAGNLSSYDGFPFADLDVYARDRVAGTTTLVSLAYLDDQRNTGWQPSIAADGSVVSFTSNSHTLHPDDSDSNDDVFLWKAATGEIELISQTPAGVAGTGGNSARSRITPDGRYVVFDSSATDLSPDDSTTSRDIYLRDRVLGTTELISYNHDGSVYAGSGGIYHEDGCKNADISADGRYVVFHAPRWMTEVDETGAYLVDRSTGMVELVGIPRWWWAYTSGGGWEPHVTNDGAKVLMRDDRGTPEHGTWGKHIAVFRLRDTSKNQVHLTHASAVWWGSTLYVEADNAEPFATWALIRSLGRTGFVYSGATFDLSPGYHIVDTGHFDASGEMTWISPPVPRSAAGLTLYLEMAEIQADGTVHDSNHTELFIVG